MVDEITPTYYAGNSEQLTYELIGSGFNALPNDIIGIRSDSNNDPLRYQLSQNPSMKYIVTEKSDTRLVLTCITSAIKTLASYLGCIVSNDQNYVIWVNNSQPLLANRGDSEMVENIDER